MLLLFILPFPLMGKGDEGDLIAKDRSKETALSLFRHAGEYGPTSLVVVFIYDLSIYNGLLNSLGRFSYLV